MAPSSLVEEERDHHRIYDDEIIQLRISVSDESLTINLNRKDLPAWQALHLAT